MALFYADSSVLVKRHVAERGSPWIEQLLVPAQLHQVATSRLATVEVISAFNRRVRDGSLPAASYPQLHDDFLGLCRRTYRLVLISNDVLLEARRLLERHTLRTYDALHLATAIIVNAQATHAGLAPLTFLAADGRLLQAARAENLATDNPEAYP